MNYVVLDLEWNQPIDGRKMENRQLPFEIIEVGAILLDENKQITGSFSQVIRPCVYRKINSFTRNLVQIPTTELRNGKRFDVVMKEFFAWCGEEYIFCTWGPGDLVELQRNLEYYKMPPISDGPLAFLDVQKLYSLYFEGKKGARSLDYAVGELRIETDRPFHRANADAYYTAKILERIDDEEILKRVSYDTYHIPKNRASEVHVDFEDYRKYISRGFADKSAVMKDREVISSKCILCNKKLRKCVRTFTPNGKYYLNVAYCEEHGYLKSKIRLKKTDDGQYYAVKTQKFISPEKVAEIAGRRAHVNEAKRMREEMAKRSQKEKAGEK